MNNIEKRINELESKNAFQEDSIERLSSELRKQQLEIVLLKEKLESFKNHIDAALELDVPLIVHSRNAEDETYEILKNSDKNLKILMHCFTGSLPFALKLMELNSYFSASGIITFKNSNDLQNTFKQLPLGRLLIETDSPFLAPEPMRGKKNEPSFVRYTLKKLSYLKDIDTQELDKITTDNFNRLFFNT